MSKTTRWAVKNHKAWCSLLLLGEEVPIHRAQYYPHDKVLVGCLSYATYIGLEKKILVKRSHKRRRRNSKREIWLELEDYELRAEDVIAHQADLDKEIAILEGRQFSLEEKKQELEREKKSLDDLRYEIWKLSELIDAA